MMQYKTWNEVPEYLKSKSYCKKERLEISGVTPAAQVYQKLSHQMIDLYDIRGLTRKKELTDNQKAGIAKRKEKLTCTYCKQYSPTVKQGICTNCRSMLGDELFQLQSQCAAIETRLGWLEHSNVVILDLETTGLRSNAEVIEISIIDLSGNVLFNSLVKPIEPIPKEVIEIHGITNEMVTHVPRLDQLITQLDYILKDKLILTYNAEFDERVFNQSLARYGLKLPLQYACIMKNESQRLGVDYYISLKEAAGVDYQSHRALGDCELALKVINRKEALTHTLDKYRKDIDQIKKSLTKECGGLE